MYVGVGSIVGQFLDGCCQEMNELICIARIKAIENCVLLSSTLSKIEEGEVDQRVGRSSVRCSEGI